MQQCLSHAQFPMHERSICNILLDYLDLNLSHQKLFYKHLFLFYFFMYINDF